MYGGLAENEGRDAVNSRAPCPIHVEGSITRQRKTIESAKHIQGWKVEARACRFWKPFISTQSPATGFFPLPSALLVDHLDAFAVISSIVVQVKVKAMEVVTGDKNEH